MNNEFCDFFIESSYSNIANFMYRMV